MERIEFDYPAAKRRITKKAHVGVVGSGDMEVLMEPSTGEAAHVFDYNQRRWLPRHWKAVFDRFFSKFDGAVSESRSTMRAQLQEAYCYGWNRQWR